MKDLAPIGTPNVNVPPPPAQTGRSWVRLLLVGGGGCLMLVVLTLLGFAGCLAALGGGGDEAAEGPQKNPTARIGEPLRVGGITWVVQDAKTVTELTSSYEKPIRGDFVVVNFTFTNEGKEAATLDTASMTLVDSEGRRNEADPDKFGYIPDGRNIFLENVNPGLRIRGRRSSPWRRDRRASSWSWATPTSSPTSTEPYRSASDTGVSVCVARPVSVAPNRI